TLVESPVGSGQAGWWVGERKQVAGEQPLRKNGGLAGGSGAAPEQAVRDRLVNGRPGRGFGAVGLDEEAVVLLNQTDRARMFRQVLCNSATLVESPVGSGQAGWRVGERQQVAGEQPLEENGGLAVGCGAAPGQAVHDGWAAAGQDEVLLVSTARVRANTEFRHGAPQICDEFPLHFGSGQAGWQVDERQQVAGEQPLGENGGLAVGCGAAPGQAVSVRLGSGRPGGVQALVGRDCFASSLCRRLKVSVYVNRPLFGLDPCIPGTLAGTHISKVRKNVATENAWQQLPQDFLRRLILILILIRSSALVLRSLSHAGRESSRVRSGWPAGRRTPAGGTQAGAGRKRRPGSRLWRCTTVGSPRQIWAAAGQDEVSDEMTLSSKTELRLAAPHFCPEFPVQRLLHWLSPAAPWTPKEFPQKHCSPTWIPKYRKPPREQTLPHSSQQQQPQQQQQQPQQQQHQHQPPAAKRGRQLDDFVASKLTADNMMLAINVPPVRAARFTAELIFKHINKVLQSDSSVLGNNFKLFLLKAWVPRGGCGSLDAAERHIQARHSMGYNYVVIANRDKRCLIRALIVAKAFTPICRPRPSLSGLGGLSRPTPQLQTKLTGELQIAAKLYSSPGRDFGVRVYSAEEGNTLLNLHLIGEHFNAVCKVPPFFGARRYCESCQQPYDCVSGEHKCANTCPQCKVPGSNCKSLRCLAAAPSASAQMRIFGGDESGPKEPEHKCGHVKCPLCKQYDEAGSHLCFVKAPKVKASTMPYVFYDTETYTDEEKQHHVHLVTAVTCCETCSGRAFPRETCRLCNGLHSAANCLTGRDLGEEFSNCVSHSDCACQMADFVAVGPASLNAFFAWLSTLSEAAPLLSRTMHQAMMRFYCLALCSTAWPRSGPNPASRGLHQVQGNNWRHLRRPGTVCSGQYDCQFGNGRFTTKFMEPNSVGVIARQADQQSFKARNVRVIWEHEYDTVLASQADFIAATAHLRAPLKMEDALYGGRVECFIPHAVASETETLKYRDVVSLYPTVQSKDPYPIGHPVQHPTPQTLNSDALASYFLALPNAVASAATTQTRKRALTGTWATPELQKAFQLGYRLQAVHALAYWTEKRTGLFGDYVNAFLKLKAESSGSPGMSDEDKAAYIADFFAKEGVTLDKVEPNPGLRFVAKIFLNSLWGKFCQRDDLTSTEIVSSYEDWLARLTDPNLKVKACEPIGSEFMLLEYRHRYFNQRPFRVVYRHSEGQWEPPHGTSLGMWTDEVPAGSRMTDFRSDDLRNTLLHGGSLQLPQFQFRRDKASCTIHTISMDKTFQRVLTKRVYGACSRPYGYK
uniref:DNA-directed DNA polymerase n=1 Tax=Macrostomum lignano TaxID=282301 RepID=A0A1I8I8M4_9PLAT